MLPRVIVMERDDRIRDLLHEILESEGYTPLGTGNERAPDQVHQLRPAAILMDPFEADDDGGWDMLRQLRADPGTARIPIVVCTADARRLDTIPEGELALANGIVLKPFELDDLLDALGAVTRSSCIPPPAAP